MTDEDKFLGREGGIRNSVRVRHIKRTRFSFLFHFSFTFKPKTLLYVNQWRNFTEKSNPFGGISKIKLHFQFNVLKSTKKYL